MIGMVIYRYKQGPHKGLQEAPHFPFCLSFLFSFPKIPHSFFLFLVLSFPSHQPTYLCLPLFSAFTSSLSWKPFLEKQRPWCVVACPGPSPLSQRWTQKDLWRDFIFLCIFIPTLSFSSLQSLYPQADFLLSDHSSLAEGHWSSHCGCHFPHLAMCTNHITACIHLMDTIHWTPQNGFMWLGANRVVAWEMKTTFGWKCSPLQVPIQ